MDKIIDIKKNYIHELNRITNKLNQLENGRVYELSKVKSDGSIVTNVCQLREMIDKLLGMIEYNEESEIIKAFKMKDEAGL
ncbi:hypothetical protein [Clostridium sp. YIM B02551]|uniref:hypothetical protein n=1 Tax=Clostridium sp. YIM B02551 TaxID=2910679 RepID=UPI001EEA8582|nr:hypothetical protein [Clostridium sp. YIM B02551]